MMRMRLVGYDAAESVFASAMPAPNAIEPTRAAKHLPDNMQRTNELLRREEQKDFNS